MSHLFSPTEGTPGNVRELRKLLLTSPFGFETQNADATARHVGEQMPTFQLNDFTRMPLDDEFLEHLKLPVVEQRRVSNCWMQLLVIQTSCACCLLCTNTLVCAHVQLKVGSQAYQNKARAIGPACRKRTRCQKSDIQLVQSSINELAFELNLTEPIMWKDLTQSNKVIRMIRAVFFGISHAIRYQEDM